MRERLLVVGRVLYKCSLMLAEEGRRAKQFNNIWFGLCFAGSVQRESHTIRVQTRQLLSSLLVSPQVSFQRAESGKTAWSSNRTWLFQCFGFSGIKQDEVGSKLILNDGTQGLCTTARPTHISAHDQSGTICTTTPQTLGLMYRASGWRSPKIFDRSGKHCVYRSHI